MLKMLFSEPPVGAKIKLIGQLNCAFLYENEGLRLSSNPPTA